MCLVYKKRTRKAKFVGYFLLDFIYLRATLDIYRACVLTTLLFSLILLCFPYLTASRGLYHFYSDFIVHPSTLLELVILRNFYLDVHAANLS